MCYYQRERELNMILLYPKTLEYFTYTAPTLQLHWTRHHPNCTHTTIRLHPQCPVSSGCQCHVPVSISVTLWHHTDTPCISYTSPLFYHFYPAQYSVLAGSVCCMWVSESVCVCVTIFLHILLLTLNYHSPPLYAGIFILLKPLISKHRRRDQLEPV